MMNQQQQRPESDRSCYLEDSENDALLEFVHEQNGVCLATAIAEIWTTPDTETVEWTKVETGVVCFVKDYTKRSYFFRLFSLDFCLVSKEPEQIWEHQLFLPFSYNQVTPFFHYFEQDEKYVGINFSFDDEADKFLRIIDDKVADRSRRYYEGAHAREGGGLPRTEVHKLPRSVSLKSENPYKTEPIQHKTTPNSSSSKTKFLYASLKTNGSNYLNMFKSKMAKSFNNKRLVIGKHEISSPRNPRHLQHVGVANNRLEVNFASQDETTKKMQEILRDLRLDFPVNKRTREFIDSFVQEHGGYEQFDDAIKTQKRQLTAKSSVKVYPSPREKPQAPVKRPQKPTAPPPPVPSKPAMRPSPTSPELSRILSPPQSPKSTSANRVINFNDSNPLEQPSGAPLLNSTSISKCQLTMLSPPPVPPPPVPIVSKIEVVCSSSSSSEEEPESRPSTDTSESSENKQPFISIISLSPPASSSTTSQQASPNSSDKSDGDSRQELLNSIQNFQGFSNKSKLRTPEVRSTGAASPMAENPDQLSLIDQLRMELIKRAQYFNSDSEDDQSESSSDSEWC